MMYSVYESFGSPSAASFCVGCSLSWASWQFLWEGSCRRLHPISSTDREPAAVEGEKKDGGVHADFLDPGTGGFMLNHFTVPVPRHTSYYCLSPIGSIHVSSDSRYESPSFPLIQHQTVFRPVMAQPTPVTLSSDTVSLFSPSPLPFCHSRGGEANGLEWVEKTTRA